MPRAFDRGVPAVDKNPLLSATNWSDPQSIIGEAAVTAGDQIRNNLIDIIKGITGIDLATVPALLESIGEELTLFVDWLTGLIDLEGLLDFLSWLWGGIEDGFAGFSATVETALKPIVEWLSWLWGEFGAQADTFLKPIFQFLEWLWAGVQDGFEGFGATADTVLKPLLEWLSWLWEEFGSQSETFLKPVVEFLSWLWSGVTGGFAGFGGTVDSVLKPLLVWLNWIWTQFGSASETFLKPVFTWLKWLWDLFGSSVDTVLKPAFEFLNWLFGSLFAGAVDTLKAIFTTFEGLLDTAGTLDEWIGQIPFIGPLVSALTGKSPLDGIAMDISSIGAWARDVLTQASDIPAGQLKGILPGGILSSIPIANINIDTPNLLSQGDFGSVGTIEAANGWEWDASQNHTGTGGCAKVTANGTLRELFSNQVIKVTAGDRINLAAYIKTSGFSGSSTSIELSLIPFVGTARYTVSGSPVTITFNSRGASTSWVEATGSASASPVTAPWTVPATVTSVRVRLAVTSAATSGTVWFDDIDLHKTGLLGQNLVEYLLNAWENMWGGLVGTSGSGKTWADMLTAASFLRNFANGTDLNLTTLGGNLLSAPASVLGSLFSVVFDGTKTVADFLRLLYNALNKSTVTTPKSADDVAVAAAGLQNTADLAFTNADDAAGAAFIADGKALTADELAILAGSQNNLVLSPFFDNTSVRRFVDTSVAGLFTGGYSTEQTVSGTYSYKVSMTAAGTSTALGGVNLNTISLNGLESLKWPVVPGHVYNYDIMIFSKSSNTSSKQLALFGGFTTIASTAGVSTGALITPKNQVKGSWDRWTGTFTIPSLVNGNIPLAMTLDLGFINGAVGAAGETFYVGRALIYR